MVGIVVDSLDEEPKSFSECLQNLVQSALDNKLNSDDAEQARKWAIVRTELEKIAAYVVSIESSEV